MASDSTHTVTLEITVTDEALLRQEARKRALDEGWLPPDEAEEFLDASKQSVEDCLLMLFDPAPAPAGCTIDRSAAQSYPA